MDLVRMELRSVFAEKKDVQTANFSVDKLSTKLGQVGKVQEKVTADLQAWEHELKELKDDVAALRLEGHMLEPQKDDAAASAEQTPEPLDSGQGEE